MSRWTKPWPAEASKTFHHLERDLGYLSSYTDKLLHETVGPRGKPGVGNQQAILTLATIIIPTLTARIETWCVRADEIRAALPKGQRFPRWVIKFVSNMSRRSLGIVAGCEIVVEAMHAGNWDLAQEIVQDIHILVSKSVRELSVGPRPTADEEGESDDNTTIADIEEIAKGAWENWKNA